MSFRKFLPTVKVNGRLHFNVIVHIYTVNLGECTSFNERHTFINCVSENVPRLQIYLQIYVLVVTSDILCTEFVVVSFVSVQVYLFVSKTTSLLH